MLDILVPNERMIITKYANTLSDFLTYYLINLSIKEAKIKLDVNLHFGNRLGISTIIIPLILLLAIQSSAFAQEKLIKDIDFDGKKDTVYIDQKEWKIVCRLSTQNFKKLKTKPMEIASDNTYIKATRNGFELRNNWMRSGYAGQFRYEKTERRIRLIGITEYAFGNAANDGSGEASANLLTGNYIGNRHYYDHLANNEQGELVKIPTIKAKLKFKKIYLEEFDEESYFSYSTQLEGIVEKHKNAEQKRRSKN